MAKKTHKISDASSQNVSQTFQNNSMRFIPPQDFGLGEFFVFCDLTFNLIIL